VEAKALSDQDLQTRKSTLALARADLESRQAAEDAVRVTVAAETAQAYLQACSNAEQGDVARRSADLLQQAYDITVRQRTLGAASDIEVQAQKQLLDAARAAVPTFDAQRTSSLCQLAVLTGQPPEVISQAAAQCAAIPPLATPIPVGDGVALLKRRPDVRAAERALAADTARIGVATAELFPTVTLGGTFQGYSDRIGTVLSQPNTTFALSRW
jgi:outer membrane protein, multidrug efflux system